MISRIRDNIFLSSAQDVTKSNVSKHNITAILSVNKNPSPFVGHSIKYAHVPFEDNYLEAASSGPVAAAVLKNFIKSGHIVLVHCKAGASRSPHVVALVLADLENCSYDKAYEDILNLHSRAMPYSLGQEIEDKLNL